MSFNYQFSSILIANFKTGYCIREEYENILSKNDRDLMFNKMTL